jgi:hypothetical protein
MHRKEKGAASENHANIDSIGNTHYSLELVGRPQIKNSQMLQIIF